MVADRHLAPEAHAFNRNWAAAGAFVRATHADLTVHFGDVEDRQHERHPEAVTPSLVPVNLT